MLVGARMTAEQTFHNLYVKVAVSLLYSTHHSLTHYPKLIPLRICNDIDNNGIDVFWAVLRALDYKDKMEGDAVVIDLKKAREARFWMNKFTDKKSFDPLISSLLVEKTDIVAALAWPGWLSVALNENLSILNKIELKQFTKHPLMGVWSLFLPKEPRSKCRKYSIQVLLVLSY
jgi:hypothetical protein